MTTTVEIFVSGLILLLPGSPDSMLLALDGRNPDTPLSHKLEITWDAVCFPNPQNCCKDSGTSNLCSSRVGRTIEIDPDHFVTLEFSWSEGNPKPPPARTPSVPPDRLSFDYVMSLQDLLPDTPTVKPECRSSTKRQECEPVQMRVKLPMHGEFSACRLVRIEDTSVDPTVFRVRQLEFVHAKSELVTLASEVAVLDAVTDEGDSELHLTFHEYDANGIKTGSSLLSLKEAGGEPISIGIRNLTPPLEAIGNNKNLTDPRRDLGYHFKAFYRVLDSRLPAELPYPIFYEPLLTAPEALITSCNPSSDLIGGESRPICPGGKP